jgi:hypothetical protein
MCRRTFRNEVVRQRVDVEGPRNESGETIFINCESRTRRASRRSEGPGAVVVTVRLDVKAVAC